MSATEVKKVRDLDSPVGQGWRICQNPRTRGGYFGVSGRQVLELRLDLEKGSAAWEVVRVIGTLSGAEHGNAPPVVSAEGRLYTCSRGGLQEWATVTTG